MLNGIKCRFCRQASGFPTVCKVWAPGLHLPLNRIPEATIQESAASQDSQCQGEYSYLRIGVLEVLRRILETEDKRVSQVAKSSSLLMLKVYKKIVLSIV